MTSETQPTPAESAPKEGDATPSKKTESSPKNTPTKEEAKPTETPDFVGKVTELFGNEKTKSILSNMILPCGVFFLLFKDNFKTTFTDKNGKEVSFTQAVEEILTKLFAQKKEGVLPSGKDNQESQSQNTPKRPQAEHT